MPFRETFLVRILALAFVWLGGFSLAHAAEGLRGVALVVGQSTYADLPRLANPAADARALDRLLSDLGFDVDAVINGDRAALARALERFVEDAADADVALLYYAGHGIEAAGENFLVPVDSAATAGDLLPVSRVLAELQQAAPIAIVLLDACRDNPLPPGTVLADLPGKPIAAASAGLAVPRGAAPIREESHEAIGTVIGFAAEPGRAALDGEPGSHSPYAAALMKHLAASGYAFGDVMTMVTQEVYLATRTRQVPWTNASLRRLLYFGLEPEETSGDEALIRGERRNLLLTIAETPRDTRALVERIASGNDVPLDALYGMLKLLDVDTSAGRDNLARQLEAGAGRLRAILAERDVQIRQDADIVRLASLADRAEQEGAIALSLQFRARASARADIIDRAIDEAEANVKARRLELAATYAGHAGTASLNFDFATAARRYADAFSQAERWDIGAAYGYKLDQADALADRGHHQGDNTSLAASVEAYREALRLAPARSSARRAANVRGNMAIALTMLGQREAGTEWLQQAAEAYRQVLADLPRNRYPEDWAYTQLNLGGLYQAMADRTGGPEYLEKAAKAYDEAGKVMTRKAMPTEWAGLQMNIGNVHYAIGQRGGGAKSYRRSIEAVRAALGVWTRETAPQDWASAQSNLGSSLTALGAAEKDPEPLREAIAAYRGAMDLITRDKQPVSWATRQNNIGSALLELAELEPGTERFHEAIDAYRAARTVYTPEVDALSSAGTYYNEGRALLFLARREDSVPRLHEAAAALERALAQLDHKTLPIQWARARSVLGEVLVEIGTRTGDRNALRRARAAFDEARGTFAANGMGDTGQGFREKQIAAIDAILGK